jgi:hypothetical protein
MYREQMEECTESRDKSCAQVETQSPLPPARRIIIGPDQPSHRDASHHTVLIHDMDPEDAALEISTLTRQCPVPDYT